jgi:hypothetical protein
VWQRGATEHAPGPLPHGLDDARRRGVLDGAGPPRVGVGRGPRGVEEARDLAGVGVVVGREPRGGLAVPPPRL